MFQDDRQGRRLRSVGGRSPTSYLHDSVIYRQPFRVFGGRAGPTRRGANMHLERAGLNPPYQTPMEHLCMIAVREHQKRVPDGLLGASVCCALFGQGKSLPLQRPGRSIDHPTVSGRPPVAPTASRMNHLLRRLYDSVIYPQRSKSLCRKGCGGIRLSTESGFPRILPSVSLPSGFSGSPAGCGTCEMWGRESPGRGSHFFSFGGPPLEILALRICLH